MRLPTMTTRRLMMANILAGVAAYETEVRAERIVAHILPDFSKSPRGSVSFIYPFISRSSPFSSTFFPLRRTR